MKPEEYEVISEAIKYGRSVGCATLARELRQAIAGAVVHTATMNDALINTGVNLALTAFDAVCQRYGVEVKDKD